jgi:hypothetical protein
MQFIAIILLSISASIIYGILHDQITARICVEYFTIGHPPVFGTQSPTLLGLGWGILATWWVGLILGIPLAVAARVGSRPPLSTRDLLRPILILLTCMACAAVLAGVAGHFAAAAGAVKLLGPMALRVPPERHVAFLTDLWAHLASYISGFIGGVILIIWVWRKRKTLTSCGGGLPSCSAVEK